MPSNNSYQLDTRCTTCRIEVSREFAKSTIPVFPLTCNSCDNLTVVRDNRKSQFNSIGSIHHRKDL